MKWKNLIGVSFLMILLLGSFVNIADARVLEKEAVYDDRLTMPKKPIMGDLDKNWRVDWKDLEILTLHFQDDQELNYYQRVVGDMNMNGRIDGSDLSILCMQLRGTGDINANGRLDMGDFNLLISYMFEGGDLNKYQKIVADIDKDRQLTLNDAIELLRLIYGGN